MRSVIIPLILVIILVAMSWTNSISAALLDSTTLESTLEKAVENEELGVYKIAIQEYNKAISMNPEEISYYHKVIDLSYSSRKYDLFEEATKKTVQLFPTDEKAYLDLCKYYYNNDEPEKVVELALKANKNLEDSSHFEDMYYDMAYEYFYFGGEYLEVGTFVGEYAPIKFETGWGLFKSNGSFAIKPKYESISVFSGGKAPVSDSGEVYYVDRYDDKVLACEEAIDRAYPFISGLAVVKKDDVYGYAISDFSLKEMKWEFATSYLNDVAAVKENGKWAIRNFDRELITDFIFDDVVYDENLICSNANVIFVKKDDLYYLIDLEGNIIIDKGFEDVKPFTSDGIAPVMLDGKWGFIKKDGSKIIDTKYDDAYAFGYGVAPVKLDGKWFYITESERIVIEGDFEEAKSFSSNGIAPVKIDGYWTFIKLLSAR